MRSLAAQIAAQGTPMELGLDTLEARIEEIRAHDAVVLLPTVVGAWGTRPATAQ